MPGQYYDSETDLFENWHRYYDATTGRYLEPDPIWKFPEQLLPRLKSGHFDSVYAYAGSNPITAVDPTGQQEVEAEVAVEKASDACEANGECAQLVDEAGEKVSQVAEKIEDEASQVKDKAQQAGAKAIDEIRTKIDNLKEHLQDSDLKAANLESKGQVVAVKDSGVPFDHVGEVKDAQRGLLNVIDKVNSKLSDTRLAQEAKQQLIGALSVASRLLDASEQYLKR